MTRQTQRIPSIIPPVLALGVGSQLAQVVLLRELLTVFFGHELSFGIILAGWMFWVATGSAIANRILARPPGWDRSRGLSMALRSAIGVLVSLPLTVFMLRGLRAAFDVSPGVHLALLDLAWSGVLLMAPPCVCLGMHFVFLARARGGQDPVDPVRGAVCTYPVEAAGNAMGGLLFTMVLVHVMSAIHLAALAGVMMLAVLPRHNETRDFPAPECETKRDSRNWRLLPVLLAVGLSWPWLGRIDQQASRMQWRLAAPDQQVIDLRQSRYGPLALLQRDGQYNVYQSGHRVFSAGGVGAEIALEEQSAAVLAHLSMTQHPDPQSVLLIGGGLRGVLREMLHHPLRNIDTVELDPVLLDMALAVAPPATRTAFADPRVRLRTLDGRRFIKQTGARYDVITVDIPDPVTAVLNRYYTREFFQETKARLAPGGMLAITLSGGDPRGRVTGNRNSTVFHTLRRVFDDVIVFGDTDLIFLASDGTDRLHTDPARLRERFREREIESAAFPDAYFFLLMEPSRLNRLNWILRHHGRGVAAHHEPPDTGPLQVPPPAAQRERETSLPPVNERIFINSDFRPIGYVHNLILWNRTTRARNPRRLDRLLDIHPAWALPLPGLILLIALVRNLTGSRRRRYRRGARYAVCAAVFTTGLSTMLLQVSILFAFQGVYGYVYERIGLIVALFMTGLAMGAALAQRLARGGGIRLLAAVQLAVALFIAGVAMALPATGKLDSPALVFVVFALITWIAGILSGADFPIAARCLAPLLRHPAHAIGRVYGLELLGSCLGAAAAGVIVVPVFGIRAACLLAAGMNAVAALTFLLPLNKTESL